MAGPRIVMAVTDAVSIVFLRGLMAALRERGAEVFVLANDGPNAELVAAEGATFVPVAMKRPISPAHDARSLAAMTATLRRLRPHLLEAGTPKASLLAMMAGAALGVPYRIHTLRGLPLETMHGAKRQVVWATTRAAIELADVTLCVGESLRQRALQLGLGRPHQLDVIGPGGDGVDLTTFSPSAAWGTQAQALRSQLGIPADARVVGFVGRLAHDKGIDDLAMAWAQVRGPGRHLLVLGSVDDRDPPTLAALQALREDPSVHLVGFQRELAPFYAAMDMMVLPSYREGFCTVILEAAAMGIPTVAYRTTGVDDAIVSGALPQTAGSPGVARSGPASPATEPQSVASPSPVSPAAGSREGQRQGAEASRAAPPDGSAPTGKLVPLRDVRALAAAIELYLQDAGLLRARGDAARARILRAYSRDDLLTAKLAYFNAGLRARGLPTLQYWAPDEK